MLRRCLVCVLFLFSSSAAFAVEPLTLFLLRMMRDQAINATLEAGVDSLRQQSATPAAAWAAYPPVAPSLDENQLKALIDESFLYLTAAQREAVHTHLMQVLTAPQNTTIKPQIIAEFRIKAMAVRESYRQLDRLSWAEKKALAAQAKVQFQKLPGDQRRELLELLQAGTLPVPRDLSDLMLAEFSGISSMVSDARQPE